MWFLICPYNVSWSKTRIIEPLSKQNTSSKSQDGSTNYTNHLWKKDSIKNKFSSEISYIQ